MPDLFSARPVAAGPIRRTRDWAATCLVIGAIALTLPGCQEASETPPPSFSAETLPQREQLQQLLDEVLEFTSRRVLPTDRNAGWQIMHAVVAFRKDTVVEHEGRRIYALDLAMNGDMRGWNMRLTPHGVESTVDAGSAVGPGHPDQWLSILTLCDVEYDQPFYLDPARRKAYPVSEMVKHAMTTVREDKEATWTLNSLAYFLPRDPGGPRGRGRMADAEWAAADGSLWNFERLLALEAAQDLTTSACGGSHRVAFMARALDRYMQEETDLLQGKPLEFKKPIGMGNAYREYTAAGGKLSGGWAVAYDKVVAATEMIKQFQQPDGSFSTQFFGRPSASSDAGAVIYSSGHTLETLCAVLSQEELSEPWVAHAALRLAKYFRATREMEVECGALYHAANGLLVYRNKLFGAKRFTIPVAPPASPTDELTPPADRPVVEAPAAPPEIGAP